MNCKENKTPNKAGYNTSKLNDSKLHGSAVTSTYVVITM